MWCWKPNQGLRAHEASTLPTEHVHISSQPHFCVFSVYIVADVSLFIGRIHEYACSSPKIHELLRPSAPSCLPRPTKLCASFPQAPWCPLPSLGLQMFSSPGLLQGLTTCQRKQRVHLSGSLQDRSLPGKTPPPTLMEWGKAWFSLSLPTKQGPQRSQGSLSPQKAI